MNKFLNSKIRIFGKSLFLMMLVLAFNCQKDETVDINAGGQPSTEVSPRQLQNRAKEIVNSEEYQAFVNQTDMFLSKIHGEDFLTEEIIDEENETYNYDVINERLSMTSFESAEEFVREYEEAFYSTQKLMVKYPDFANPLVQERMSEERRRIKKVSKQWSGKCVQDCWDDYFECKDEAEEDYGKQILLCTCVIVGGPLPTCLCVLSAMARKNNRINRCRRTNNSCIKKCNDRY